MQDNVAYKDRLLLEELSKKYSPGTILGVITQYDDGFVISPATDNAADSDECVSNENEESNSVEVLYNSLPYDEAILEFLKRLEGYRVRFREYHWETKKISLHNITDNIISKITEIEDDIAEDMQGLLGIRIKVGTLIPILPQSITFEKTLVELLNDVMTMCASIEDVKESVGVQDILNNFVHFINKSFYLGSFE